MNRAFAILALAGLAALSACAEEKSVVNQFEETGNEIRDTANAIESDTANAVRSAEDALDADAIENRIDAIDIVRNDSATNAAGNSQ